MTQFLLGIIAILFCNITYADIYQWVDEHGHTQFSDEPPKQGNYQTLDINTTPRTATPTINSDAIKQRQQKQLQAFEEERLAKQQAQRELTQKKQQLHSECLRAKDYLELIQTAQVYQLDKQGQRVYKTEEQRQQEIKRVEQAVKNHCR